MVIWAPLLLDPRIITWVLEVLMESRYMSLGRIDNIIGVISSAVFTSLKPFFQYSDSDSMTVTM